jgi:hypothetical protein
MASEPCRRAGVSSQSTVCGPYLRCNASGICEALPSAGEPCYQEDNAAFHLCGMQASCDFETRADIGTCIPRAGLGEPCFCRRPRIELGQFGDTCEGISDAQPLADCELDVLCHCESCDGPATCKSVRREGESCAAPTEVCERFTECEDGVCVAVESLGLFERVCMP